MIQVKNLEKYLNKRVKVRAYSSNEYIGKVTGYVLADDNEPKVEEIGILNEKDNKTYTLFENEIASIEIIE